MNESVPSKCKQKKGEILSLESVSKKSIIFRWINYLYGKEEIVNYQKYRSITKFFIIKKSFYTNFSSHLITITIKSCLGERSIKNFFDTTHIPMYLGLAKFFRVDGRTQAFLIRTANDGGSWKY